MKPLVYGIRIFLLVCILFLTNEHLNNVHLNDFFDFESFDLEIVIFLIIVLGGFNSLNRGNGFFDNRAFFEVLIMMLCLYVVTLYE